MVKVSNKDGKLVKLQNYNHSEKPNKTLQDFINALKCKDLNKDPKKASALIILSSESCRSQMVLNSLTDLLTGSLNFSQDVWNGLEFAFKNYSKTAKTLGYKIQAEEEPWEPLIVENYLKYINSDQFTGDKAKAVNYIEAVQAYINPNEVYPKSQNPVTYPYSFILDACGTKEFIFEFSFEDSLEQECDLATSRYVAYRLFRKDLPKNVRTWAGCLSHVEEHFNLNLPDGINIDGTLRLFKNLERYFVWIDTGYCYELEEHFEGNIIEIPSE